MSPSLISAVVPARILGCRLDHPVRTVDPLVAVAPTTNMWCHVAAAEVQDRKPCRVTDLGQYCGRFTAVASPAGHRQAMSAAGSMSRSRRSDARSTAVRFTKLAADRIAAISLTLFLRSPGSRTAPHRSSPPACHPCRDRSGDHHGARGCSCAKLTGHRPPRRDPARDVDAHGAAVEGRGHLMSVSRSATRGPTNFCTAYCAKARLQSRLQKPRSQHRLSRQDAAPQVCN